MYNIKLIEYPNGSAQIRLYSEPVGVEQNRTKQTWEYEPFTMRKARVVTDFEDNSAENQRKSLSHTKSMIGTYARCAFWEWFVTLTYDAGKIDRTDFKICMKKVRDWLHNCRRRSAPDLKYLVVPELHADGTSWHIHALLSDTGKMVFSDSGHKISGQIVYNLSGWKWGFSTATKVRDIFRIQKYIVKYMTKDCHKLAHGAHRYYVSKNLPKPDVSLMLLLDDDKEAAIQTAVDSLGLDIVYRSEPKGDYVQVEYIELQ